MCHTRVVAHRTRKRPQDNTSRTEMARSLLRQMENPPLPSWHSPRAWAALARSVERGGHIGRAPREVKPRAADLRKASALNSASFRNSVRDTSFFDNID